MTLDRATLHEALSQRSTPLTVGLAGLGGLSFFLLVYGPAILNPSRIAWLLWSDPAVHYLGFAFFRRAAWSVPLGLIPTFGAPLGTTVVYTDSIPLLAIPFKALSPWLPRDFQYFGLWLALCHVLTAALAARLLLRLGVHPFAALAGAFLLLTSPAMALRMYGQPALTAHWLLLAGIDLLVAGGSFSFWALIGLASLIHAYWVPMLVPIAVLAGGTKPIALKRHALGAGAVAALMAATGYFSLPGGQLGSEGFGFFNANVLTFLDPMDWNRFLSYFPYGTAVSGQWSRLLPPIGYAWFGQSAGFAYLGAGALAAVVVAACLGFRSLRGQTAWALRGLLVVSFLLFLWALAGRVTLGPRVVLEVPVPTALAPLLNVFRATGRFVWPLAWALPIVAVREIGLRFGPARATLVLSALLALQGWDLGQKWEEFGRRFAPGGIGGLPDYSGPGWRAARKASRLVVLPAAFTGDDWIAPALFAARHGQSINVARTARPDPQGQAAAGKAELEAVLSGAARPQTAYLVRDPALAEAMARNDTLLRIDQGGLAFFVSR